MSFGLENKQRSLFSEIFVQKSSHKIRQRLCAVSLIDYNLRHLGGASISPSEVPVVYWLPS